MKTKTLNNELVVSSEESHQQSGFVRLVSK